MADTKTWLITGVSSGLGRDLMQAALAAGHSVAGTVRKAEQIAVLEALAPGRAHGVVLDVTDGASVAKGVATAADALGGRIDVLVNNAGWGMLGAVEETSEAEAREIFDANFFGQLNVTRAVMPTLRAQRSGHIFAASAIGGFTGVAGLGVYAAAKAATDVMNEALAQEAAPFGIKVTVLTLGIFRTNFASTSLKETERRIAAYDDGPSGQFRSFMEGLSGKQPNDPAKAAEAILKAVAADKPPLHLPLGEDALGVMTKKIEGFQADIAAWRDTAASVVFPDARKGG